VRWHQDFGRRSLSSFVSTLPLGRLRCRPTAGTWRSSPTPTTSRPKRGVVRHKLAKHARRAKVYALDWLGNQSKLSVVKVRPRAGRR
jgi:hypothetical protein